MVYTDRECDEFVRSIPHSFLSSVPLDTWPSGSPFINKIYLCSLQEQPFVYVDNDVIINKACLEQKMEHECVFYLKTRNSTDDVIHFGEKIKTDTYFFHTGISGGNTNVFFKSFWKYLNNRFDLRSINDSQHDRFLSSVVLSDFIEDRKCSPAYFFRNPPLVNYPHKIEAQVRSGNLLQIPESFKPLPQVKAYIYQKIPAEMREKIFGEPVSFERIRTNFEITSLFLRKHFLQSAEILGNEPAIGKLIQELPDSQKKVLLEDVYHFEKNIIEHITAHGPPDDRTGRPADHDFLLETPASSKKIIRRASSLKLFSTGFKWYTGIKAPVYDDLIIEYNLRNPKSEFYCLLYFNTNINAWDIFELDILSYALLHCIEDEITIGSMYDALIDFFYPQNRPSDLGSFTAQVKNRIMHLHRLDFVVLDEKNE
ncbi:MAG: hypothetical protein KDD15_26745 [Lewinella sp.]|nr:hypothetical protein [Lewinella sp.]